VLLAAAGMLRASALWFDHLLKLVVQQSIQRRLGSVF
jgi:hypothetical protein